MLKMELTTAVIYFARNAKEEVKHKVFCNSNSRLNDAIALQLYNHTYNQVAKTGLPFFCFTEQNQQGSNFSEKLANAFQEVFQKGYHSVIAVGSDSPGLTASHITEAAHRLVDGQLVAGTTAQGGCYLIGVQQQSFDYAKFTKLSWQTSNLAHQIEAAFNAVVLLRVLSEVNNQRHLSAIINGSRMVKASVRNLIQLINSYKVTPSFALQILLLPHPFLFSNSFGRAP